MLWKVCAVCCAVAPVVFAVLAVFFRVFLRRRRSNVLRYMVLPLASLYTVGYILCRIILVVLTFTSLRALPPGVYKVTSWTLYFLPHIG